MRRQAGGIHSPATWRVPGGRSARTVSAVTAAELDDVDRRILAALRRDGRLSSRALGTEVGMSAGAVAERVRRLESTGAIRGYGADVDPRVLGHGMRVLVGLQVDQGKAPLQEVVDALLALPEVVEVGIVSGQWDLVVTLQVKDQHHLRELVSEGLWGVPGFRHSESMLVLESFPGGDGWLGT